MDEWAGVPLGSAPVHMAVGVPDATLDGDDWLNPGRHTFEIRGVPEQSITTYFACKLELSGPADAFKVARERGMLFAELDGARFELAHLAAFEWVQLAGIEQTILVGRLLFTEPSEYRALTVAKLMHEEGFTQFWVEGSDIIVRGSTKLAFSATAVHRDLKSKLFLYYRRAVAP